MRDMLYHILFAWYPYLCLTVFLVGSLIRFDREQYSWKASSSQLLRKRQLRWGSNLFHFGILFLLMGHTVGLLTPTSVYTLVMTVPQKQMIAIVAGGIAGTACFIGLTMLLHRRLVDPRIRQTSTRMDIVILSILWVQLTLGLITIPFSLDHSDGSVMLILSHWAQAVLTLQPVHVDDMQALAWPYVLHLVLGMTIFLLFPFSRLVHIWSAPVWYLGRRGYQVVRSRRLADAVRPSAGGRR
ncbi:respiratory nitrate reductase subunit gamma [Elstera cyanobacteriorum]|uniref:nitrate reductase (quinone) n=1 Tax=Elstera cyanobacteriorum TaxID=2022747 RepID=A0A255XSC6_9PROT|nr:respiratory nitrate reductase subunit gamma [Elstera cyanobacteriorum]MCK6444715.1 respiratory nitrate reductase subunit gamma [Elstera cyanobacteriorum]OYQ19264.1 respiratory nitrate reductase subunit gamma [Elstera cyanobacteriorum]GFZ90178.1 respiratory nitrate reductase subunit gamma [Elstera cyanobacteriorum]